MPPPSLHPRSGLTTSLFGTTLLVSFLIVGMPHILPCPAPRVAFADSEISEDGRTRRRRRREKSRPDEPEEGNDDTTTMLNDRADSEERNAHECPVPKPRGLMGEMLGFGRGEKEAPRPKVQVETRKEERRRHDGD